MPTISSLKNFPQPPTYAEPTIVDERTKKAQFNPIWLKWFLDVANILSEVVVGASVSGIDHEQLGDLLGGDSLGHYHLRADQLNGLIVNPMDTPGDLIVGGTIGAPTRLGAGATGTKLTVISPGVLGWA